MLFKQGAWNEETLCYAPLERFKELAARQEGEKRIVADYYYGRRLACSHHEDDPIAMTGYEFSKLWQERESERLQGLSLMLQSGGLKVLFPKQGQSFNAFFFQYLRYDDVTSVHYEIDGCRYFTSGTLLCPDEATFERLKSRFEQV